MTSLLPNFLAGRWQTGQGGGTALFDPVLGSEVARVDAGGLDLEQGFGFARDEGGSALRSLTYRERGQLLGDIVVEECGLVSIRAAREAYLATNLREKLARYHADVDSAFRGWNDIWLDPRFKAFDIRPLLPAIRCPVLAVQGLEDEYGTLEQIRGVARGTPRTELLEIPSCGHSPQRDQPEILMRAVRAFCLATEVRAKSC